MSERLLQYVLLICLPILILWLAGKLLHVSATRDFGPANFGSRLDADDAFDHALMKHRWQQLAAVLMKRQDRLRLASLDEVALSQTLVQRSAGEQTIPVHRIVGSVHSAGQPFDQEFRPTHEGVRRRFTSVYVAMRKGESLPPIDVQRWHGQYYVTDGHHRVAAARALGQRYIDARVTEVNSLVTLPRVNDRHAVDDGNHR
jgi:ParB-like nuclease family protein